VSDHTIAALTDEHYWTEVWSEAAREDQPAGASPADYLEQELDRFFRRALTGGAKNLLEVGCGSSRWMPYFAHTFGLRVSGIDYSQVGCDQAEALLREAGVRGDVLCRDALAGNSDLVQRFDVVISLGLVEHFADTAEIVRSLARYVRPGGLLISTSPNLAGVLGAAQRILNRPVYEGHVPFQLEDLAQAHCDAGLTVEAAAYIGGLDFHMVNLHGVEARSQRLAHTVLMRLSRIGWHAPFTLPRNRWFSSAMAVSARKPG
jgi:2-polyprenyl-3-methyl-5-hydroxy-6-metoxy-1,4-benzoquinol methylase